MGRAGVQVSEVGLGCWQLGREWGDVSETAARAVLDAALDAGVTFLDTADVYGDGRSEQFIGDLRARRSERPFVATKLGRRLGYPDGYSYEVFRESVQRSLRNLRCDTLDLVQLHCIPKPWLERPETFGWLRRLRDEGLIRHYGASVETIEEGLVCLEDAELASLQVIFNVFRQRPAETLLARARAAGVAIIARLPLASGLLGGHIDAQTRFDPSDHRHFNADGQAFSVGETFSGLGQARGVQASTRVAELCPPDMSRAEFALRWILDHEAVTVVIPGARTPAQVRSNAAASERPSLSTETHARLRTIYETEVEPFIRGPQ